MKTTNISVSCVFPYHIFRIGHPLYYICFPLQRQVKTTIQTYKNTVPLKIKKFETQAHENSKTGRTFLRPSRFNLANSFRGIGVYLSGSINVWHSHCLSPILILSFRSYKTTCLIYLNHREVVIFHKVNKCYKLLAIEQHTANIA